MTTTTGTRRARCPATGGTLVGRTAVPGNARRWLRRSIGGASTARRPTPGFCEPRRWPTLFWTLEGAEVSLMGFP